VGTVHALRNTWGVRDYIIASVRRDFVARYLGTQLGWFWAIAQPIATILIYTLVFAEIMRPALPGSDMPFAYSVYLCSGLFTFQLFSELLNRCVGVFVNNANLLRKVSLPKFALPTIVAISSLTNFGILLALFLGFLLIAGIFPGPVVLAMFAAIIVTSALALGLGMALGVVNVYYRDVEHTTALILNFWFWLTPIVYPVRALPEWAARLVAGNPMASVVAFAQGIFLDPHTADWWLLVYPAVLAAAFVVLGLFVYRRLGHEIVDEL
jgi:lipopolysaccharide transport system permease protein